MMHIGDRLRYLKASQAVYALWKDEPEWTHEQAAFLLAGYHPHPFELVNDYSQADIDVQMEVAIFDDVTRQLKEGPYTPEAWIQFALQRGLPIPEPLAMFFPNGRGIVRRCGDLERELSSSRAEIAALQETTQDAAAMEKPIPTKERESLLKLVIGMAVGGYKFDPKAQRNDATGEIEKDLDDHGVPLDADTIRKYLREGAELAEKLPPKK